MPPGRRKGPHIVQLSGFNEKERKSLAETVKVLGGEYLDSLCFEASCTHVVCALPSRAEKFLCGCAAGKWVVSRDFINDSAKTKQWGDEEKYEWSSRKPLKDLGKMKDLQLAPKRWRLAEQRPFAGWRVCLLVKEQRKREAYKRLVEAGDGLVYEMNMAEILTHVFVDNCDDVVLDENRLRDDIPVLPLRYIQECLLQGFTPNHQSLANRDSRESSVGVVLSQDDSTTGDMPSGLVVPVEHSVDHNGGTTPNARVWKIVSDLIDEGKMASMIDFLSSLCSCSVPPADVLHTLLTDILLNATSVDIANKVCVLLRKTLWSSPPWVSAANRRVYMEGMASRTSRVNKDSLTSSGWSLFCDTLRILLQSDDKSVRGTVLGATKLFEFFFSVLTQDYTQTERQCLDLKDTILCQLLWCGGHCTGVNSRIRELFAITIDTAAASEDNACLKLTVNMLCQLIAHISQYCLLSDKKFSARGVTPCSDSIVAELSVSVASSSYRLSYSALKLVVESMQPAWLLFRVCQTVLDRFASVKEKGEKKSGLLKVVTDHMWLIPSWSSGRVLAKAQQQPSGGQRRRRALGDIEINTTASPKKAHLVNGSLKSRVVSSRRKDVKKRNRKGETLLQLACIRGDSSAVAELLQMGADPNTCDNAGWTPLHESCFHGNLKCVSELIRWGVTLEAPVNGDRTAVYLLTSTKDGTTPLHDAVGQGHTEIVKLLVKAGGKRLLDMRQKDGLIPGDMAVTDELKAVLKLVEVTKLDKVDQLTTSIQLPSAVAYSEILGETAVPLEACKVYSLLLAHELRACLESKVIFKGPLSNEEVGIMKRMPETMRTFGCHLRQLMKMNDLPDLLMRSLQVMESVFHVCNDSNHASVN